MSVTMELVRFSVVPGREAQFVSGRAAAVEGLRTMPGLLSATLARADDGTWVDVVLWRSRKEALAADQALRAGTLSPEVASWASAIQAVESMTHAEVHHHAGAPGADGPVTAREGT